MNIKMTIIYIDNKDVDNINVFAHIEEASKYVKPGDKIVILSSFETGTLKCKGSLKQPIVIEGTGSFKLLYVNGQYLDLKLKCEEMYLTDCLGLTILCSEIGYIHATNIAMTTLFQLNFNIIEMVRGSGNEISSCTGKSIKLDRCEKSLISNNTVNLISLIGDKDDYQLGTIKNNDVKELTIYNGVLNGD